MMAVTDFLSDDGYLFVLVLSAPLRSRYVIFDWPGVVVSLPTTDNCNNVHDAGYGPLTRAHTRRPAPDGASPVRPETFRSSAGKAKSD